ncbi:hypothetical protein [Halobiforma nitratireducens]|uniref:DUF2975 domain-containing protein n=1 Tax=Halobiforma nitratireducens JCM 10879 TaxID=1227454 RepID=M0LL04_9EURY|nr:hypothetical protein [Halobiforma nitratireducens]EMA33104.1 hypothetical protein C446_14619 [Halobiforma nitratireducens JCM 10879]
MYVSVSNQSLVTTTVTYVGTVILIGFPVATVLNVILGTAAETLNLESLTTVPGSILIPGVSLVIGLQLAMEAAIIQLSGIDALGRGSVRIAIIRHLVFAVAAASVLIGTIWAGATLVHAESQPSQIVLGMLVALAAFTVLFRASRSFFAGMRLGRNK